MHRSLFILLLLSSCQPEGEKQSTPRAEFLAVAERIESSRNSYLGRAQIPDLRYALQQATNPLARALAGADLSRHLLRLGQVEEAVQLAESAWQLLSVSSKEATHTPELLANQRRVKITMARAYLRLAEVENCIDRHNQECCIFPLEGGGVHTIDVPARRALEIYLELARDEPDDLSHRWMCNLLATALADHPSALPSALVIPLSVFDSEIDIGRFLDVGPASGVDVFSLCGGSAVDDFDGDGLLDIVFSNFDPRGPLSLFRNDAKGGFDNQSDASGLSNQLGGLNLVAADYDSDGDCDLLVLRGAWLMKDGLIRNSLLRNEGNGVFTDVTHAAGVALPASPTQTAAFGDFDADGDLDFYVGNEAVREADLSHRGLPSQLFLNDGDGSFTLTGEASNDRYCKGVAAGDYDDDGDLDLYCSNIGSHDELGVNRLYQNNGSAKFKDVAPDLKVDGPRWSFATWFFDYDNDGQLDLFVAGYDAKIKDITANYLGKADGATRPRLYRNLGGTFSDVAVEVGLDRPFLPMGANFGDFDNDGWLDIYLATGSPPYETLMPNIALRNDEGRRFQDMTNSAGLGHLQKGHGITFADIDNDGDQDLIHELGGFLPGDGFANALFENPGHGNRFLQIELVGSASNRAGIGTRIRVEVQTEQGSRTIHRAFGSVSSFGGAPRRMEIGLGAATTIRSLELWWPTSNKRQRFQDVPLDSRIRVEEDGDRIELLPREVIELGSNARSN